MLHEIILHFFGACYNYKQGKLTNFGKRGDITKIHKLSKIIKREKLFLNILLKFLSPTNKICVLLSQKLDKHVAIYQHHIYVRYKRKHKKYFEPERLTA